MSSKKEVKKITLSGILSWIFGIFFALVGLGAFTSSSPVIGITSSIMAAVLLPPMNKMFKQKMNFELSKGVKIAVIIMGLVVIGMIDTDSATLDDSKVIKNNQDNTLLETQKETVYSMNQNIDVDYITYRVTKVETFTEMGNTIFNKETEGKFVKVYLRLTNNAAETKQIFSARYNIEDSKGRVYDRVSGDVLYIADYIEFGKQLQPGLGTSGAIVFELPTDSEELKLIISGDWISTSEVEVELSNIQDVGKDTSR